MSNDFAATLGQIGEAIPALSAPAARWLTEATMPAGLDGSGDSPVWGVKLAWEPDEEDRDGEGWGSTFFLELTDPEQADHALITLWAVETPFADPLAFQDRPEVEAGPVAMAWSAAVALLVAVATAGNPVEAALEIIDDAWADEA